MQDAKRIDIDWVRRAVENNLAEFREKPLPELLADIRSDQGMIPDELRSPRADIFRGVVCERLDREQVHRALADGDLAAVVAMLMAATGIEESVPGVFIEVAELLRRVGLDAYCATERDLAPPQPGTAPIPPQ